MKVLLYLYSILELEKVIVCVIVSVSLNKLVVSYIQGFPYNKIVSIFEFLGRIVPSCLIRLQKHLER